MSIDIQYVLISHRPDLNASTPEPSLYDIIWRYYRTNGIDVAQAHNLTDAYLKSLTETLTP